VHRPCHRLIRRILQRKRVPERDIEDVHQDVMEALITGLPKVDGVRSMEAWVASVALHHATDYMRWRYRRGPVAELDERSLAPDSQRGFPAPDRAAMLKERRAVLDVLLERMEPELRDVFILIDIEEMPIKDAAKALGQTYSLT
jgi:RNA polymerase sigma factor (sigma-70 family)